jgi:hypothetical protein
MLEAETAFRKVDGYRGLAQLQSTSKPTSSNAATKLTPSRHQPPMYDHSHRTVAKPDSHDGQDILTRPRMMLAATASGSYARTAAPAETPAPGSGRLPEWTNLSSTHMRPPRTRSATKAATSEPAN